MDQPPVPTLPFVPYAQASPAQLAQALLTSKETLGAPYAELAWPHWDEAFAYFQPLLVLEPNQVSVTAEGLTAITQYFNSRYPVLTSVSSLSAASAAPTPSSEATPSFSLHPTPRREKKTYALDPDILESLKRVSFWRRMSQSALVNLAVAQLMATYPESQVPLPLIKV